MGPIAQAFQSASKMWEELVGFDPNITEEDLLKQFHELDKDNSGSFAKTELRTALTIAVPEASNKQIEQLLSRADAGDDGEIDFEEFKTIVYGKQKK